MKKLKLAGIGCGGRTRTYLSLAGEQMKQQFEVVAAADPQVERAEWLRRYAEDKEGFKVFDSDVALLAEDKLADIVVIGTQDSYHVKPCIEAMRKGYDVLLEKPISPDLAEVVELEREAVKLGRRVMVCHVLRYAPFYRKVKEIIDSGVLGEIRSLNASEGVGPFHFAHAYVRGHWRNMAESSPIIISKSCHDMDIISWLMGDDCVSASSYGSLSYFNKAHAPDGAPARCIDGCPQSETCRYNAMRYLSTERNWVQYVFDSEGAKVAEGSSATEEEMREWLKTSNWGRCVYQCDNDAPDHQTAQFEFKKGQTATFTVTAFDGGRNVEIYGTKGCLKGGHMIKHQLDMDTDILVMDHETGEKRFYSVDIEDGGYEGHGGGDYGLVSHLYEEMCKEKPEEVESSITQAVQSHIMGFAAEESRVSGKTVVIEDFLKTL